MSLSRFAARRGGFARVSALALMLGAGLLPGCASVGTEAAALTSSATAAEAAPQVSIAFEEFRLANGLRVIVHTDRKAPVVAVSVWYGVGSKDEPTGKTGFAHLFEHLMFNGSENYNDEWFGPFEEVGATDMNGTTWFDRTNYFQTVPTPALDMALWMESDRMGHFLGAVTQERLDEQRDVVKNEKRQGDNQPYGLSQYRILEGLFPPGHPYRHSTIGSMEDLSAASLEDVQEWFKTYYGPNNAVLVLAGDIDAATARPMAEKYFGDIAAGPPLAKTTSFVPRRTEPLREVMEDRAPQPRLIRAWAAPGLNEQVSLDLAIATQILGGGRTSRLHRALVHEAELAASASAYTQRFLLASQVGVDVRLKPGSDLDAAHALIDRELERFITEGPTQDELDRVKTQIYSSTIRGLEVVGGFGGKAVTLAEGALYSDDPGFYQTELDWVAAATTESVRAAAAEWMHAGVYQLDILPMPRLSAEGGGADRSALPKPDTTPDLTWPAVEEATLDNGMKLVFVRRDAVPVVNVRVQFAGGYTTDSVSGKLGLASFATAMMDDGAGGRDQFELAEEIERLGAGLSVGAGLDTASVSVSALSDKLSPSLALFMDVLTRPDFPAEEIPRLKSRWLANIEQEKAQPNSLANRMLPPVMFGAGHPYAIPFTGTGTPDVIRGLTREDLVNWHQSWIRPELGTVFVVGDTTLSEITTELNATLGQWKPEGVSPPLPTVADVALPTAPRVILVDKPNSPQSLIFAGHVGPRGTAENDTAITAMNDVLGGQFTARINMNLREAKGWSYGAYSFLRGAKGPRPFLISAPVQSDRTGDSIRELQRELNDFLSTRPPTEDEVRRVVLNNVRSLPGSYETAGAVLGSLAGADLLGLPYDRPAQLKAEFEALTAAELATLAREVVRPQAMVWMIVGDRAKIEDQVRALNLGTLEFRDLDGNVVQ
jgi:zinc protease